MAFILNNQNWENLIKNAKSHDKIYLQCNCDKKEAPLLITSSSEFHPIFLFFCSELFIL